MDVVPVVRTATSRWTSQFQSDAPEELSTVSVVFRPTFLSQTPGTVWAILGTGWSSSTSYHIDFHIDFCIVFRIISHLLSYQLSYHL
jgi:hypothetical protein